MATGSPILHILAGPNGAGKTTLYEARVRQLAKAPFVNADQLSSEALGRHAESREEAELGQSLANARRDALMSAGESLVTESTFSHPSKLDLIRQAKALGYRVFVYHVNVESADDAVARVAAREARGGHPVPEANIRGRYERNQPLIREAVRLA
ncbi:MAG: AAA family ATPase, partial [Phenylobacterium sp.]